MAEKNLCWMRKIRIELTSTILNQTITIGDNDNTLAQDNLNITIAGTKYAASNKDKGLVTIYNLNYETIIKIIIGQFYKIKILVGYRNQGNLDCVFSGSVSYISKEIYSHHDTKCYISYASDLVASFSQKRINLSQKSGINIYGAIEYMMFMNGATNLSISPDLRYQFITKTTTDFNSGATALESLISNNTSNNYILSTGGEEGTIVNVMSSSGKKVIKIERGIIPIGQGNPTVDSKGLKITLLPTRPYLIGEILEIDMSLINVANASADATSTESYKTSYMDSNGRYLIYEISYNFCNRGDKFEYNIRARALDLASNLGIE